MFFSTEIVSDILARVSDKNPPNIYEETPLHRAAKNGHDRCIEGCRVLQFWILNKVNPDFIALYYTVWQYGLWSYQTGGTKLEKNLPKNQHT